VANRQTSSSSAASRSSKSGRAPVRSKSAAASGERDEHYDVISVLYHSLKGAETVGRYIEEADDDDIAEFLEETKTEYADRAKKAKQLLADKLSPESGEDEGEEGEEEGEEEEDEEEDEEDEDED
jgi:hypothetical protein